MDSLTYWSKQTAWYLVLKEKSFCRTEHYQNTSQLKNNQSFKTDWQPVYVGGEAPAFTNIQLPTDLAETLFSVQAIHHCSKSAETGSDNLAVPPLALKVESFGFSAAKEHAILT